VKADAGIGEIDIDAAEPFLDLDYEPIKVGEICDIALYAQRGTVAEFLQRAVEGLLVPAGDDDPSAFGQEFPGSREPDATAATRDDGDFPYELSHSSPEVRRQLIMIIMAQRTIYRKIHQPLSTG
jgi:hypothetical protein